MPTYRVDNRPKPINWEANTPEARTLQNVKNLLTTRTGEVPYARNLGVNSALFDMTLIEARMNLRAQIEWMLEKEPDAKLVNCRCSLEQGELVIELDVEIDLSSELEE